MWGLGVVAYAVAVFQRGSLAVSGLEFQHRFHAGAADLSMLAVLQLGVYAATQVPVGLLLVLLVLVFSANGPGSLIGFDYARSFNPRERLGSASGIVNLGGFVASLFMIMVVGLVLGGLGKYTLAHFRLAFLVQYALWGFGLFQILRLRAVLRRRRVEQGIILQPLHRAVADRLRRDRQW